jgi:SAM-dependent methyltransferase
MENYKDVVNRRFDQEDDIGSIYSPNHPIGKYIREVLCKGLDEFLNQYSKDKGELITKKLLDVGCGDGGLITYFICKGFSPQNITGIDLSKTRIYKASRQNPSVTFILNDLLTFQLSQHRFDLITAFDLFSHFTTESQILQGLSNVFNHLEDDGIFLWYDIYSKDHFSPPDITDSWGFNKRQMIYLSETAGFELISYRPFFKNFLNRFHSAYQVKRLPSGIIKLFEKILPGMPGNLMLILKKQE